MTKKKIKKTSNIWHYLTIFGLCISLAWILMQIFYYQPKMEKLDQIEKDFGVVVDYYEVLDIAQSIPLPSPLGPIENLDYSPITVYKVNPDSTVADFRGASYGYILRLSTGLNTYLATSGSQGSSRQKVLYTIGELRQERLRLRWFIYNGVIPPNEWVQNESS